MSQFSEEQLKKMKDLTSEQTKGGGVMKALFGNATYNKVLCNDGSIQTQANYPNARVMDACANNGGRSANQPTMIPNDKVPLSISNPTLVANMKLEQEKKFAEMKKKSLANTLAKASIVPIGLYAFSKYNKYDTKKTLKVTIIGSVVILGAVVLNGFSGAWSGTTFLDSLIGKSKKPLEPTIIPKQA